MKSPAFLKKVWWQLPAWLFFLGTVCCGPVRAGDSPLERVTIGALLPLSGENSSVGVEARKGIELALRWFEPEFRKKGYEIRVAFADDAMEPEKAEPAFRKLVAEFQVPAVIGPFTSPEMIRLAPLAAQAEVPLVSGSVSSPRLRELGPWVFSIGTLDDYQGRALARFAYETLRCRRAAVLYLDNAYGGGLKRLLEAEFSHLGGEVVFSGGHHEGDNEFLEDLDRVRTLKPHCLFVATYPVEAGLILKEARALGLTQPVLGGDGIYSEDLIEVAGPAARDTYATAVSWRPGSTRPRARRFVRDYTEHYGVAPGLYAASYFDAASVVMQSVLARAGQPPGALREYLAATPFEGVTGAIHFGKDRAPARPVDIYKVEDFSFDYFYTLLPR